MKVLCSHVMAFAISFSIFFYPQICYAGDIVPAGTELTEESYVFTVEEATALLKRIEDLEAKEVELEKYKDKPLESYLYLYINSGFVFIDHNLFKQLQWTSPGDPEVSIKSPILPQETRFICYQTLDI